MVIILIVNCTYWCLKIIPTFPFLKQTQFDHDALVLLYKFADLLFGVFAYMLIREIGL